MVQSNLHTILYVSLAFIVSITLFLYVMSILPDSEFTVQQEYYSQNLTKEKKIFLIGSSHIFPLNTTHISLQLENAGHNYKIYNLAFGSDVPETRLRTMDLLISQQPDLVVYGLGFRDFISSGKTLVEKPQNALPGPEDLIEDILSQIPIPINSGILENPKFALVRTFNELSREDDTSFLENHVAPYPNTPFFTKDILFTKINDYDLLLKQENNFNIGQLPPPDQNYNLHNLKEIIHKLRTNNIDVILFTHHMLKFG